MDILKNVNQYLLFIDTEASGLPKKWNEPYSKPNNWPNSVQTSWVIFDREGQEIKREDHYIRDQDFKISSSSIKIHGITSDYLATHGKDRREVMQKLYNDLTTYKPLVVGHFMELDYHVLAADFLRSNLANPIEDLKLPAFCTMMATTKFVKNPQRKFMKLGELYDYLFHASLIKPHNAIYDAKATADCFFELLKRGDLSEQEVTSNPLDLTLKPKKETRNSWAFFSIVLLFILLIALAI
ncbi:3'-5' exonuclease [Desertivirga arenae]|uniref:3'-5' exonuclease n=1 Tax=Desertivirga arenae TaxID=2810309 RepID=UPI001F61E461|nr:3'-5' exonuclease [Pedobacter sp. SYSU D00823]